jgi:endo-1,4-beta-xylanase
MLPAQRGNAKHATVTFAPGPGLKDMSKRFAVVLLLLVGFAVTAVAAPPYTNLKDAYGKYWDLGCAIPGGNVLTPAELAVLEANFTNITPEGIMKPEPIEPDENRYTFDKADAFVATAQAHGLKVNGHCLVWHETCPDWFFQDGAKPAGRDLVLKRMIDHVTTEVSHFRGKVFSWDVVNEALADGPGYLRDDKWSRSIGPDYIAQAFRAAQAADPQAELYYNDYHIESPAKRDKAIRLIRELKAQHLRIDGVGIQGHWQLDKIPYADIDAAITAFHNEGVKVMITELDVDVVGRHFSGADVSAQQTVHADPYVNGCPPEVLARQADQYAKLFALLLKHKDDISRVTFWGLDDAHSWLNTWPYKRTNYPLLWDRQAQPKPALAEVLKVAE